MSMRADLQEVRLYGEAGRLFGRVHHFQLDSGKTAEAISALVANFPKIEAYFVQAKDRGIGFAIFRGKKNLTEKELTDSIDDGPIRIAPMIIGSKSAGLFQIIAGIVIIAASAVYGWWTGDWVTAYKGMYLGGAMIMGGVVQMLAPAPKGLHSKDAPANQASYAFSGPVNTQAQGNPVPVLYGEMIVGSAVISAGISAADDVIAGQGPAGYGNGGMGGGCPTVDSLVRRLLTDGGVEEVRAGNVKVGDVLEGADPVTLERMTHVVTFSEAVLQPCVVIHSVSSKLLECSTTAPIPTPDGLVNAPNVAGHMIAELADDGYGDWCRVKAVRSLGERVVQHISLSDGCYWVNDILHHNKLSPASNA
jgi:predicted phage tail protein